MQKIVNMDIQTILISIVICVVVAILVYLITVCSMREKSFEEVIAEQRRMQEQVLQKNRQQKKQRKEKFKKGKGGGKSSTDEADSNKEEIESEPVVAETHKMVELEIDPVIIEPTEMKKEHKKENKKNAKQPKPILHNKDEKPLVKESAEVEQFQPEHMPKDSVELKYSEKKKGKESKKEKAESKERVKEPAVKATEAAEPVKMVVEESIQVAVAAPTSASVKSGKKVKPPPEAVDTAEGGISGTKLITMVRSATLSDKDIQHLIEILLNRQGTPVGSAGWKQISKGSDPVAQLKKQLEDKERAWQDEAKRAQEYSTSLRETQRQLSAERQKVAMVEKQSHEQLEAKNQEIQAFHSRMQQSHEQHMHEVNSLTMKVKHLEGQMGQDHTAVIRRLQEENNQLKTQLAQFGSVDVSGLQQKVKIMEEEMNKNAMKISSADNIKKGLEAKVAHYEEQLRKYEASQRDSESVLSRKLNEVTEQLRKAEAQNNNLNRDLQGSRDSSRRMENDLANMKNKLQSMEQARSDRENMLKTVEAKLKDSDAARKGLETKVTTFEHQLADKDKELQELKQANASLTVEVKTVQEVHSQQGAPAQNGPVDEGDKILLAEHERILAEKSTEVGKLSDDLSSKTAEIDKLRQEVDAQKKKNNELEAEKLKATSQVQTELKQLKQDLNTKVSEVEGLTTELETLRKQNNELQDSTSSQIQKSAEDFEKLNQDLKDRQAEVANLQKQLESQQNQNKDLSARVEKFERDAKSTSSTSDDTKKLKEELDAKLVQIKELETLVAQLKEENADSKNLKETLDAKLVHIEKLESSVRELKVGGQADTKNLQEKLDAKVVQIEQLEALVAQLKEEKGDAKNLQEMLDAESVQIQELEVSVKQLTEEKAAVEEQILAGPATDADSSEFKSQLHQKDLEIQELQKQLQELTYKTVSHEEVFTTHSTKPDEQQKLAALQQEIALKSSQIDQLGSKLKEIEKGSSEYDWGFDVSSHEEELSALKLKILELEQERARDGSYKTQLEHKEAAIHSLEEQIEQLEVRCALVDSLERELRLRNYEVAVLNEAISGESNIAASAKAELVDKQKEIENRDATIKALQVKLEKAVKEQATSQRLELLLKQNSTELEAKSAVVEQLQKQVLHLHSVECELRAKSYEIEKLKSEKSGTDEENVNVKELLEKNKHIEEKSREVQSLNLELHDLRLGKEQVEKHLQELQIRFTDMEKQLQEQREKLKAITVLEAEIDHKNSTIKKLYEEKTKSGEMADVLAELVRKRTELEEREREILEMKNALENVNKEQDQMREATAEISSEDIFKLQTENENLLSELMLKDQEIEALRELQSRLAELDDLRGELVQRNKDIQEKEEEIESLYRKLENFVSVEADRDSLRIQLEYRKGENSDLLRKIAEFKDRLIICDKLETEVNQKTQEIRSLSKEKEGMAAQLKMLNNQLNEKRKEVASLKMDLQTMSSTISEVHHTMTAARSASQTTVDELEEALSEKTDELQILQLQLQNLKHAEQKLMTQKDAENASLSQEITKLQVSTENYMLILNEKEQAILSLQQQLKEESDRMEAKLCEKDEQIAALEQTIKEMASAADGTEALADKNKEIQELKNKMQRQAVQMDELQIADMMSELQLKTTELQTALVQLQNLQEANEDLQSQVGKLSSVSETTEVHVTQISSLNEEINIKVTEITKLNQEIESLKKENHELRAGCEKATAALTSAEKSYEDIAHVQAELSSKVTEVSKLQLIIQEREKENKVLQDDLGELRRAFRSAQDNIAQLREAEKKILICSELQSQVSTQSGEITVLKKTISDKDVEINELQAQMRKRHTRNTGNSKMDELLEELDVKDDEIAKLRDIVKNYWKENNELKDKLSSLESNEVFTEPRSVRTSADSLSEVEHVEKELHLCRRQISLTELKERMEKTVENGQVSSGADEDHSREVLKRLFPDVKVKEELSQEEWLQTFAIEVKKMVESSKTSPVQNGDMARELQETRQSQSKLQSQVQHYKSVLADTEGILNKLQSSVETEEKHWKDKLEQVQSEKQKLEEEVKRLKSSEVCRGTEV